MYNPTDEQLAELGLDVCELAANIFDTCGCADDFCIQSGTVFGGTNRLLLTARGWRIDRAYCTERFIRGFDVIMGDEPACPECGNDSVTTLV